MKDLDVKICGLTCADDALKALELGADFLGFVLYAKSPRGITVDRLEAIRGQLPADCRTVGVFVNAPPEAVRHAAERCRLAAVQIHGDEPPDGFQSMAVPVWRAVHLRNGECVPAPARWPAGRYVIDAAPPGLYGGSGETADWDRAAAVAKACRAMLAGGLTAANVSEAITRVHPAGVDVSSGVEASPGKKDYAKVAAFITAARAAVV